jgi:hypothetical protein
MSLSRSAKYQYSEISAANSRAAPRAATDLKLGIVKEIAGPFSTAQLTRSRKGVLSAHKRESIKCDRGSY